jgi:hypothetical protein
VKLGSDEAEGEEEEEEEEEQLTWRWGVVHGGSWRHCGNGQRFQAMVSPPFSSVYAFSSSFLFLFLCIFFSF